MPRTTTKISITVPTHVLAQAEQFARPGEGRSAVLSRLLDDALQRELEERYAAGYRRHPVTPDEDAFAQAAASQGFADAAR